MRIKPLTLARSGMDQFGINPRCGEERIGGDRNLRGLWDEPEHRSPRAQRARRDLCRNATLPRSWRTIKQRYAYAKVCSQE